MEVSCAYDIDDDEFCLYSCCDVLGLMEFYTATSTRPIEFNARVVDVDENSA